MPGLDLHPHLLTVTLLMVTCHTVHLARLMDRRTTDMLHHPTAIPRQVTCHLRHLVRLTEVRMASNKGNMEVCQARMGSSRYRMELAIRKRLSRKRGRTSD